MNRVQIVRLDKGETRWKFVAHGAAYERPDAEGLKYSIERQGGKVVFLPLPEGA